MEIGLAERISRGELGPAERQSRFSERLQRCRRAGKQLHRLFGRGARSAPVGRWGKQLELSLEYALERFWSLVSFGKEDCDRPGQLETGFCRFEHRALADVQRWRKLAAGHHRS